MNRNISINTLQRASFTFMVFMVNLFNYSSNPVLKTVANISVLVFIVVVLVPIKNGIRVPKAFLFYFFFLAFCFFSILLSTSRSDTIHKLGTLLLLQFEFLAIYNFVIKESTLDFTYFILAICATIVAVFIIIHAPSALQTSQRVGYITGDSNQSSAYLAYGSLILFFYLFNRTKIRWICLISLASTFLAIVLQGSRTSTVVAGVVLILEMFLLMRYEKASSIKQLRTFSILLISLAIAFFFIMSNPTLYKTLGRRLISFYEIQTTNQSSISETSTFDRLAAYELAIKRFFASPLFGNGLASFAVYSEPFLGRLGFCPNNYLELLQGIGLIGTLFYYSLYLFILKAAYTSFKKRDTPYSAIVISILFAMLLEHLSVVFYYHKLEYLFLGVLLASCSHRESIHNRKMAYDDEKQYHSLVYSTNGSEEKMQETGTILARHLNSQVGLIGHTGKIIWPKHMGKRPDER